MPFASTADGLRIYYLDSGGAGPPLLVVFGQGSNAALAPEAWLAPLERRFRVLRVDNRGVGRSSDPDQPFRIEDMATDAVAVLDAAGVDRACLYGHSMGGMIAQALARDYPDRVRRIVFEATAPSAAAATAATNASHNPAAVAWRMQYMTDAVEESTDHLPAITAENARTFFGMFLAPGFLASPAGTAVLERVARVYAENRGTSQRTLRWQRQAVMAFDNWAHLPEIKAPALVIHPSEDIPPLAQAEAFARALGNGRLHVVPGVGHDVRWEAPELSAQLLIDFFSECG
jgi:pimeloyl-ACP methyl ester carboxylesterase